MEEISMRRLGWVVQRFLLRAGKVVGRHAIADVVDLLWCQ
jgi:hypothetical protein